MGAPGKRVPHSGRHANIFIRLAVGLIFGTQGILKFIDPNMGVNRFAHIGFPHPQFLAYGVGFFEILCGAAVLIGMYTRLASVPLLVVITTAIVTTKLPELSRSGQGFWFMVSDARTDFSMLCSLIFLLLMGGGAISLDRWRSRQRPALAQPEPHPGAPEQPEPPQPQQPPPPPAKQG